jgi:anti-sigma B factor antagonist
MLTCLLQLLLIVIPSRDIVAVVPMPESKLDIQERHDGDVTVLILTGQITLDDGDLLFRKKVHDLLDQGRTKIVVDIGSVTYIDSAGVGMMAAEYRIVRAKGGVLKLLNLGKQSHRLLATMKLMTVFEVFDDEGLAIRSFTRS